MRTASTAAAAACRRCRLLQSSEVTTPYPSRTCRNFGTHHRMQLWPGRPSRELRRMRKAAIPDTSDEEELGFEVDPDAALPNRKQEAEMRWLGVGPPLSSSSSDSESDEERRAKRRRRETNTEALGLGPVLDAALHPLSAGSEPRPPPTSRIEGATDAEASLLAMEVQGLLAQARPDSARERPLLRLLEQVRCGVGCAAPAARRLGRGWGWHLMPCRW